MTSRMVSPKHPLSSVDRALPVGTRLEEYEIEGVLAQSSVALVYRALDHERKQQVAIKEYMPVGLALRGSESRVELHESAHAQSFELGRLAFLNEAQMLAGRKHGSLLHTLRILQLNGTVYRVMRYCPGPMLSEHRRAMTAAPDEKLLRKWLDHLLGALAELHQLGLVHAAVSPGNILMLSGDQPVLLDSDAVRSVLISDHTRNMIAALAPCFAPIEQRQPAADRPLGPWTDLYALAGTLRFCITGQVPATPAGEVSQGPSEPLRALWRAGHAADSRLARVPAWLTAFDDCLAEPARDRPQSVAQLRATLERLDAAWRYAPKARPEPLPLPGSEAEPAAAQAPNASGATPAHDVADMEPSPRPMAARTDNAVAAVQKLALQNIPLRALPRRGRRQWPRGGAALLLVLLSAAAGAWMWKQGGTAVPVATAPSAAAATPAPAKPAAVPSGTADLVPPTAGAAKPIAGAGAGAGAGPLATPVAATRAAVAAATTATNAAEGGAPRAAAKPAAAPKGTAPSAEKPAGTGKAVASVGVAAGAKPAPAPAARPATPVTSKVKAPPGASSAAKAPRELCAGRARYALLQCMQAQCEKREWSRHEQCVRLRTERKLS
ncbi:MAG TPA: hypothetical protein VET87_06965 [Rubrivivax sp.]|nr:hypothetical protein [Rubrivivax sp.]